MKLEICHPAVKKITQLNTFNLLINKLNFRLVEKRKYLKPNYTFLYLKYCHYYTTQFYFGF